MKKIQHILFDLDGTLTDPKEGITKSVQHALTQLGQKPPSMDDLEWAIGPPLTDIFSELLNTKDNVIIQQAIVYYRERYENLCHIENKPYVGIEETLAHLQKHYHLYLATSKPWSYAGKILEHFNLHEYFKAIHGSELDGTRDYKEDLINYILEQHRLEKIETLMIGDRHYDIEGAKKNNIFSIGVTYGYGSLEEITAASPDAICHRHQDIVKLLIDGIVDVRKGRVLPK